MKCALKEAFHSILFDLFPLFSFIRRLEEKEMKNLVEMAQLYSRVFFLVSKLVKNNSI